MCIMMICLKFLLTRPSRDVTLTDIDLEIVMEISTHTSLAGRDDEAHREEMAKMTISTHTSLAGRDSSGIVRYI